MYSELDKKLEEVQQKIHRLNKIDAILADLRNDEAVLRHKVYELKAVLDKEILDVEKLDSTNIVSIFYSITGKLEDKKEKEQREALSAKLKHDQASYDLYNIETEISKLTEERENYKGCVNEYNSLYQQKKNLLIKSDSASANKILEMRGKIEDSKRNLKEIKEAVSAGQSAANSLDAALDSLSSAQGWGTWDLLGGGLISDLAKHSHIDDAMSEAERAHQKLREFKSELADVRINYDIRFETDGFAKFADFFFDGLIADWYMQSKIDNSYESIANVKNQVESTIFKLQQIENEGKQYLERLENELKNIIIGSQLNNSAEKVSILRYINGKISDEQEVDMEGDDSVHTVKDEVELYANDTIEIYVNVQDKYGINYKHIVMADEIDSEGNLVRRAPEWTNGSLMEIKNKNGKTLFESDFILDQC